MDKRLRLQVACGLMRHNLRLETGANLSLTALAPAIVQRGNDDQWFMNQSTLWLNTS